MSKISDCLIVGEEIAEHLAGMTDAEQAMAIEHAVTLTMSTEERIKMGNRITSYAVYTEVDALEVEMYDPLPKHITDALDAMGEAIDEATSDDRA